MNKKLILALATLTLLLPALGLFAADETTTLHGEYVWQRQDKDISGPLKAVFEPNGEASWNVSFHFTFEEKEHLYKGVATGSLDNGELKGEVMTDGEEPRPFEFRGAFEDGTFQGEHMAKREGETHQTGTMTLHR